MHILIYIANTIVLLVLLLKIYLNKIIKMLII